MARPELTPLDSRARLLFHLQAFSRLVFFWVPVSVVVGAAVGAWWSVSVGVILALVLLFLNFLMAVWYPTFAFDRWGYSVREDDLLIARGVFLRRVTAIPIDRIQHVDTRQGIIEQWIGLARLQVFTASGIGADGVIPGLDLEKAEALRDELVKLGGTDDGV